MPVLSFAQRGETTFDPITGQPIGIQDTIEQGEYERVPDTVRIIYFNAENPSQEYIFSDSLLNNDFHQDDPTRKENYANLGNLGSAHRPIIYETPYRQGFDVGLHQFDLYQITKEDFQFYNIKQSYTDLFYSQGPEQNDANVKAKFNRRFAKGLTFGVHYKRYLHSLEDDEIPLNENVFYKLQGARATSFGVGFWQQSKNKKYDAFLTYISNQVEQQNHGGIISSIETDSILANGNSLETQTTLPIYLDGENANSRYATRTLTFTHHYKLGKGSKIERKEIRPTRPILPDSIRVLTDSTVVLSDSTIIDSTQIDSTIIEQEVLPEREIVDPLKRKFRLSHEATYQRSWYKYADPSPSLSLAYYGDLFIDERGLRHYMDLHTVSNSFSVNTFKPSAGSGKVKKQKDLLDIGLVHSFHKINQEPIDTTVNNLFLKGKWNYTPNERFKLQVAAHLGLWNNAGDYRVQGDLALQLGKLGALQLKALQQLYEPNLIQRRTFISQQLVWNQAFSKTLESSLVGTYYNKKWDIHLSANLRLINNYIYFDASYLPQQEENAISILQFLVQKDFTLGKLHLDNQVFLQQSSAETLPLPTLFSRHSLYFEGKIFKNIMLTRIGLDLRMQTSYFGQAYNPLIGQFHLQDEGQIDLYPNVDAFFSFKIDRFRAFARMQNLTSLVTNNIYYQTPNYAEIELYFRFGVSWLFIDENKGKSSRKSAENSRPNNDFVR